MSKTNDLLERYVNDEYKAQIIELNSNPYLGIYGVVLGVVIANTEKIATFFKNFTIRLPWALNSVLILAFTLSGVIALLTILIQSARIYNKDIHRFQLDQEVIDLVTEERAKLMNEQAEDESLAKLDEKVSEAVRLRIIHRIVHVNKRYRKLNRRKASIQRVTVTCLWAMAVIGFFIFVQSTMLTP